jgi:hypothetical protein
MPISSLVLTLEAPVKHSVYEVLAADPRVEVGEAHGLRLPVVTETRTLSEGEALAEQLGALPGVTFVDVVLVDFSDAELG